MRNILILIILISGLIFTSLIKNKTRLLEKELLYLDKEINILSSDLSEASLDFHYLTTPERISLLAKNFLNENFMYYKESQIKKSIKPKKDLIILKKLRNDYIFSQLSTSEFANKKTNIIKEIDSGQLLIAKRKESQIKKLIKPKKDLVILKKLKNDYTFSQLNTNEFTNKKTNVTKEIDNEQLFIAQRIDSKNPQKSKKIISSKKVQQWAGIQIIKALLGIPTIPFE
jgi:hypothetical protein